MTETNEGKGGGDRVRVETAMHHLFRELTEKSSENPEAAPFIFMKDVFMWAVAVGVDSGRRLPLSDSTTQIFRWDQLSQDLDIPLLKALALAETNDMEMLVHENQILRLAEEYANAGIREIREELLTQGGQPLWNLVAKARS